MTPALPATAYLAALASLPYMDHATMRRLLERRSPEAAWAAVLRGHAGSAGLARAATKVDPATVWRAHADAGVSVHAPGDPGFPACLESDPEPPPILFGLGLQPEAAADGRIRVGIVGTRRATPYGREVAAELGSALAQAGVTVVSGLAAGIDGAAHEGALAGAGAPPLAVVGSGLDVVYPRRHQRLWRRVADSGLVLSEAPLGGRPEAWRFPARNRIIAAFSDVLVVVESHAAGGSMHTVRAATDRGVPVMAVPGSIRSPASAGTNLLLTEGVAPVTSVDDVLVALALERSGDPTPSGSPPELTLEQGVVLDALGWEPADLDTLLRRVELDPGRLASLLAGLEARGVVACEAGWWHRR